MVWDLGLCGGNAPWHWNDGEEAKWGPSESNNKTARTYYFESNYLA